MSSLKIKLNIAFKSNPFTIVNMDASTMTNNNKVKDKICSDIDKNSL